MLESGGVISTSITLAVAAIGAGMLAFPLAFANLGLVAATLALVLIAFFTVFSFYYLALGVERMGLCSYEDLTRVLLGPSYEKAIRVMLVALNFGVAVCYVVVIAEMLVPLQPGISAFVGEYIGFHNPIGALMGALVSTPSRCLALVWLATMLPLSLSRSMAALRYTTALAIAASVYIVIAVVYRQLVPSEVQGHPSLDYQLWNGPQSAIHNDAVSTPHAHKVGHVNYASNTASTPSHGRKKPRIRSAMTMGKVAGLSMILAGLMYFLVGTFGYLSFGDRTRGNILQNYHPTEDYLMAVGYSLYALPVIMAYALTIFPLRDAIFNYLYGVSAAEQGTVISPFTFVTWSIMVSVATLIFGILTPGIVVIIGLLGALCSSTLCFILPAWYRIQMHRRGLLPFGCKEFADPVEVLSTDNARQQDELQHIVQQQKNGFSPDKDYGSILENGHSSSYAELAAIQHGTAGAQKDITVPLSPFMDAILAYSMLALGLTSAILGTTAAFLNIVVGIGE